MQDHSLDTTMTTKNAAYRSEALIDGMEGAEVAEFSEFEAQVLALMKDGRIKTIISRDPLIKKFGALLYEKLGDRGFSHIVSHCD